jgi:hypothetical protein
VLESSPTDWPFKGARLDRTLTTKARAIAIPVKGARIGNERVTDIEMLIGATDYFRRFLEKKVIAQFRENGVLVISSIPRSWLTKRENSVD